MLPRIPVLINREILRKILSLKERRHLRDLNEERSADFYSGAKVLVRMDGWDGAWIDANVTRAHFRAPF